MIENYLGRIPPNRHFIWAPVHEAALETHKEQEHLAAAAQSSSEARSESSGALHCVKSSTIGPCLCNPLSTKEYGNVKFESTPVEDSLPERCLTPAILHALVGSFIEQ